MERVSEPMDTIVTPMTLFLQSSPQTTKCSRSRWVKHCLNTSPAASEVRMGTR